MIQAQTSTLSRRELLARIAGAGLVVGFSAAATGRAKAESTTSLGGNSLSIDSWLTIANNGAVTVYSGKVELGTGVQTALTQIVAEELYLQPLQITFVQGDTSLTPGDKSYTAGSKTIQNEGPPLRFAAATAFQALLNLAAQQLNTPPGSLVAINGFVGIGAQLQQSISYGALVTNQQLQLTTNTGISVKNPSDLRLSAYPFPVLTSPPSSPAASPTSRTSPSQACCTPASCIRLAVMPTSPVSIPHLSPPSKAYQAFCKRCSKAIS